MMLDHIKSPIDYAHYETEEGKYGLVIGTFLLPTEGHIFLIDTAYKYMKHIDGKLAVSIAGRSKEPISTFVRKQTLVKYFEQPQYLIFKMRFGTLNDDNAPQNDNGTQEFWDYWVRETLNSIGLSREDISHVFASEPYGKRLAQELNAKFIPVDINRVMTDGIKGSNVRSDIRANWNEIILPMRQELQKSFVFFGADSTGKSTMSKRFANDPRFKGTHIPEWARDYLENNGTDLSDEKMQTIARGQFAVTSSVRTQARHPWIYMDTDLLTTIGYNMIYNKNSVIPLYLKHLFKPADFYIVMNSNIPFEKDDLRYGITKRESTDNFWIELLEEFKCNFYVVKETDHEKQFEEIAHVISQYQDDFLDPIEQFQRD